MARVIVDTVLEAPLEAVWAALMRPRTLVRVTAGLLGFRPIEPPALPDRWAPGEYLVALRGFGFLPLGRQVIGVELEHSEGPRRMLRDNGRGTLLPRWDHRIVIEADGPTRTRYRDDVTFEARILTPLLVPLVRFFYRYRQRGWHRLVAEGLPRD